MENGEHILYLNKLIGGVLGRKKLKRHIIKTYMLQLCNTIDKIGYDKNKNGHSYGADASPCSWIMTHTIRAFNNGHAI